MGKQAAIKEYDVIIIGAGPAGLTAARLLAASGMKILLVEKDRIGFKPRTWVMWLDELEKRGYGRAIINRIDSLTFRSFLGGGYNFNRTPSAIVDTKKLLSIMKKQAADAGVEIHENEEMLRYREEGGSIHIETEKRAYAGRYCVDATGAGSCIQEGLGGALPKNSLMGCYALELEGLDIKDTGTAVIFDAAFPGKNYFWLLPYSREKALAGCFFFSELDDATEKKAKSALSKYLRVSKLSGKATKVIRGNIPLAERKNLRYGRIFFCGDSLSCPLPSSGFGLLMSFQEAELLAAEMIKGFRSGVIYYERKVLEKRYPGYELHYIVSDILKKMNDPLLDVSIRRMSAIDSGFIGNFLKGDDLSLSFAAQAVAAIFKTYSVQEIASMAIRRDYKEFLLHMARVYPAATPAVIKKTLKNILARFLRKNA